MVEKEIELLSNLYTEVTQRYRAIKVDGVDEEIVLEHIVKEDIESYLLELLNIIPRSITVYYENRLTIHLWKNTYYDNQDGNTFQTDAIIIGDEKVFENAMVFNEELEMMKFSGKDKLSTSMNLKTLEFICSEWMDIKKEIYSKVVCELNEMIKHRLEQVDRKKSKLQNFKDWEV